MKRLRSMVALAIAVVVAFDSTGCSGGLSKGSNANRQKGNLGQRYDEKEQAKKGGDAPTG